MGYDLEYTIIIILSAIFIFGAIFFCWYTTSKEQKNNENVYNLLMQNELEFVDNFIETKYKARGSYYNIVYKENGEIKKVRLTLEQYYNIVEKYQKTIDKQE